MDPNPWVFHSHNTPSATAIRSPTPMPPPHHQLDLLIVGLARSGTTLLTHLLTNPNQRRLCLAEPRLTTRRAYRPGKQTYFRALGFPDPVTTGAVSDHLFTQDRAGIKEVRAKHIRDAIRRFNPRQIVLITRDARAALASYHERHQKRIDALPLLSRRFPAKLFVRTAPLMLRLLESEKDRVIVTQYERFVSSEQERDRLANLLDWPLDGELSYFAASGRGDESKKHNNVISTKSLTRPLPADNDTLNTLTPVLQKLVGYQRAFGYPLEWDAPPAIETLAPTPEQIPAG